jgi:hypothetical protein
MGDTSLQCAPILNASPRCAFITNFNDRGSLKLGQSEADGPETYRAVVLKRWLGCWLLHKAIPIVLSSEQVQASEMAQAASQAAPWSTGPHRSTPVRSGKPVSSNAPGACRSWPGPSAPRGCKSMCERLGWARVSRQEAVWRDPHEVEDAPDKAGLGRATWVIAQSADDPSCSRLHLGRRVLARSLSGCRWSSSRRANGTGSRSPAASRSGDAATVRG